MPKLKKNSGSKKRFSITGTGKVRRKKAYMRHILTKKATKRKRHLSQMVEVSRADIDRVKRLLLI
ncbi:MAG: 50S ribosomal protein L35 [Bacteroidia bacterium]|nr:50S ribosomal protein L35 [Bacteroidia bacterium]MDW8345732.1 50S ribosomal protein L35 [Bacteroidia bacterium]